MLEISKETGQAVNFLFCAHRKAEKHPHERSMNVTSEDNIETRHTRYPPLISGVILGIFQRSHKITALPITWCFHPRAARSP